MKKLTVVKPVNIDNSWDPKKGSLLTGGRYSEVPFCYESKKWDLKMVAIKGRRSLFRGGHQLRFDCTFIQHLLNVTIKHFKVCNCKPNLRGAHFISQQFYKKKSRNTMIDIKAMRSVNSYGSSAKTPYFTPKIP